MGNEKEKKHYFLGTFIVCVFHIWPLTVKIILQMFPNSLNGFFDIKIIFFKSSMPSPQLGSSLFDPYQIGDSGLDDHTPFVNK
jgi:hypothetical protein